MGLLKEVDEVLYRFFLSSDPVRECLLSAVPSGHYRYYQRLHHRSCNHWTHQRFNTTSRGEVIG